MNTNLYWICGLITLFSAFVTSCLFYFPLKNAERKKDRKTLNKYYRTKIVFIFLSWSPLVLMTLTLTEMSSIFFYILGTVLFGVFLTFSSSLVWANIGLKYWRYSDIKGFIPNNFHVARRIGKEATWYFVNDQGIHFGGPYGSPELISPKLLFAWKEGKGYCLINTNGQELPGEFNSEYRYYNEEKTIICLETNKKEIYFISDYGKILAGPFKKLIMQENIPWRIIKTLNDEYYYYDDTLEMKLGPYLDAEYFNSAGIASVQNFHEEYRSIINQSGEEICSGLSKTERHENYILARRAKSKVRKHKVWHIVRNDGISDLGYIEISSFSEDKAVALDPNGFSIGRDQVPYVYINMKGEKISPLYHEARSFNKNRAIVKERNGWFIINEKFEELSLPFEEIRPFREGYAVARDENHFYLLDMNGKPAVGSYDYIWDMSEEGFARCLERKGTDGIFNYYLIHISENPRNIHKAGPYTEATDVKDGSVTVREGHNPLEVIWTKDLSKRCSPPFGE